MVRARRRGAVVGMAAGAVLAWGLPAEGQAPGPERLRVFLDCPMGCESTFVRDEIQWVDWVRDRADADVHLLVSSEMTGSGGRRYTLAFIGREAFEGVTDEIELSTSGDATQDERREDLAGVLALGLGPYLARGPGRRQVRMQLRGGPPGGGPPGAQQGPTEDPWDYWVFNLGVNGSLNGESSQSSSSYGASIRADRVTDAWKIRTYGSYSRRESEFELTDTTVTSVVERWSVSGLLARSLGPHWSAGARTSAGRSTFNNEDLRWDLGGGVEYDIFPYSESTRRKLTVQYVVGVTHRDYQSETIYGLTEETRPNHQLAVSLGLVQPWGQSSVNLSGLQYLHDTSFYNVGVGGSINLRLVRGLELRIFGQY
ncbi:MAG: DUF481 domain-containing protein, partial [Longimicrobiales bacterium]